MCTIICGMGVSEVVFEVGTYLVCRWFGVPVFDVFCKYAYVGDYYFANDDELGVCFRGTLGFGHCGVLVDGVEDIEDRIPVDLDVVYCLIKCFIEDLIVYFVVCAE